MADVTASGAVRGETQPVSGCFVWLGWMFGGNTLLFALTILIARGPRWTLTFKDVLFWILVGLVVLLRYVDMKWFSKRTADGEPVSTQDFRRYVAGLVGFWLALWALGHSLALDR